MTYNLYNVYKDGDLILENVMTKDVVKCTGVQKNCVASCAKTNHLVKGTYRIEVAKRVDDEKDDAEKEFIHRYGMKALAAWKELNRRYGTVNN